MVKGRFGKFITLFVILLMVFSALFNIYPIRVSAAVNGGDGSSADPYKISTVAQLNEIRNAPDKHYILVNNINMTTNTRYGTNWLPVTNFTGSLDGKGFTINYLTINRTDGTVGLFAKGTNATVKNVNFTNVNIVGGANAGTIFGTCMDTLISDCTVQGTVSGKRAGGLVGTVGDIGKEADVISRCQVTNSIIKASNWGGGIAGLISGTIQDCEFNGSIEALSGEWIRCGGIVGQGGTIISCSANVSMQGSYHGAGGITASSSTVKDCTSVVDFNLETGNYVGGIAGGDGGSTVIGSVSHGTINISGGRHVAGIMSFGTATDSISYTNINVTKDSVGDLKVAGIVSRGSAFDGEYTVNNCISLGTISGNITKAGIAAESNTVVFSSHYIQGDCAVIDGVAIGCSRVGELEPNYVLVGNTVQLGPVFDDEVFDWDIASSSDPSVLQLNEDGSVTGLAEGSSILTVDVSYGEEDYSVTTPIHVGNDFAGGAGTVDDPLLVSNADQLKGMQDYKTLYYKLANDIDLGGANWEPIGSVSKPFSGGLDGNNHTIFDLTLNSTMKYAGLFGYCYGATFKNVNIDNAYITVGKYTGGLSGAMYYCNLQNCISSGEIINATISNAYAGMFAGYFKGGNQSNCYAVGDVQAEYAGVFAGYMDATTDNCYWYDSLTESGIAKGSQAELKKVNMNIDTLVVGQTFRSVGKASSVDGSESETSDIVTTNFKLFGSPRKIEFIKSSNPSVVSVSGGNIKGVKKGTALITTKFIYSNNKTALVDYKVDSILLSDLTPASFAVDSAGYNSIKLSWKAVQGASGYMIYRATSSGGAYSKLKTQTGTSFRDSGLTTGKTYYYKVRAYQESESATMYSQYTAVKSAKPIPATPSVRAVSAGYNSIKLSWKAIKGASGYTIYRATSSGGAYSKLKAQTGTSFTDSSLTTGKTYYYKVRAYRKSDSTTTYGSYSAVKSAKPVPAVPTVTATSAGYNSVKISWKKISGASGYEIYRATSKSGTYTKTGTVTSGSTVSYTNKSLTTGTTYYYKVRAYRTVNSVKLYGAFSAIKSVKPVPAVPDSFKAVSASSTSVKLSWKKVSGASGYEVYRATSKSGKYSKATTVTGGGTVSYTDKSLAKGKTYYYKVRTYRTVSGKKVYGGFSTIKSIKL